MDRPQFKPHFRCEIIPGEGVFLLSEKGQSLLRGGAYIRLAPLLTGRHTVEELIELLQGQVSAPEVLFALELLQRKGFLVEAAPSLPPEQAAFWTLLDVAPEVAARRLLESRVALFTFGRIDPAPLRELLARLDVTTGDEGQFWVALADDYLWPGLAGLNERALAKGRPWLLARPVGVELWLGPLFIPGQTGCWACLAHRLQGHRKVESYLQDKTGSRDPFAAALSVLPSTQQTALGLVATETARWLAGGPHQPLAGQVITLDSQSLEKRIYRLVRRPQCPRCGDPAAFVTGRAGPPALQHRPKGSLSPEETFKGLEHHLSPITGVVSALQRTTTWPGVSELTNAYVADHNFIRLADDLPALHEHLYRSAGGKGQSDIQARVSAMAESIERYSGVFQGDEARVRASLVELGSAAVHPNDLMLYSRRQYERREQINNAGSLFQWVPQPFDENQAIEWSPAWSLTRQEVRYVPTAYCYFGYSRQHQAWYARADENGGAAGNNLEEAILQGFLELVERDSVALWWYNCLQKPGVDLASFDEPYFQGLQGVYQTLRRELWVLDITGDLGIPAFAALSRRVDKPVEDITLGFGCHFEPRLAVLRALTELNQFLPAVVAAEAGPDVTYPTLNREAIAWWQQATVKNQPYLRPDPARPPQALADYARCGSDDLYTAILTGVEVARARGLETLVLDQTRPDMDLHVVKVMVPGLRPFWPRFGPGRLYEVPVQMGWLAKPFSEEGLNPQYICF